MHIYSEFVFEYVCVCVCMCMCVCDCVYVCKRERERGMSECFACVLHRDKKQKEKGKSNGQMLVSEN